MIKTLQQKVTMIIVATSFFALLVAGVVFMSIDYYKFKDTQVKQLKVLAEVIGKNSIAAIDFADFDTASEILSILKAVPQVNRAAIYQNDGSLVARYSRDSTDTQWEVPVPEPEGYTFSGQYLNLFSNIETDNRHAGYLYIFADLATEKARWNRYVMVFVGMTILAFIVAIIVGYKLQNIITKPVMDLAKVASKVSTERDYSVRVEAQGVDEIRQLVNAFNDMLHTIAERELERDRAEMELKKHRDQLEEIVQQRTKALQVSNNELEAFSYSVSHDLRAPVRSIHGFSQILLEDYGAVIDDEGKDYIQKVQNSAVRMTKIIDSLMTLSRINRAELVDAKANLSHLVEEAISKLQDQYSEMSIEISVKKDVYAYCDVSLIAIALDNIVNNALKYSSKSVNPKIEFGVSETIHGEPIYFVKDNGVGLDMKYADKIFMAFKRLHNTDEYPGTGIGLATVQRIIERHGGKIWVESEPGKGATFYFVLHSREIGSNKQSGSMGI